MKKKYFSLFTLILMCFITSCNRDSNTAYDKESFNMDTTINQHIYGNNAPSVATQVYNELLNIEKKMTVEGRESEIAKLNHAAGNGEFVTVSPDTAFVIEKAKYFYNFNGGDTFDITVGPLITLWGITKPNPHVPSKEKIDALLPLKGMSDIEVNPLDRNQYRLKRQAQSINLGGIAKGYAGDSSIAIYKKNNISSAFINLGGNVVVLGSKPDGSPWKIGIQNPRAPNGRYLGIVEARDCAVVTSGDYERFFEENNIRYHHILDPKTGYPAKAGLLSVTVVTASSIDADALTKKAFVGGLDVAFEVLGNFKETGGIFITEKKEVYITKNLEDKFKFNDESGEYKFIESR